MVNELKKLEIQDLKITGITYEYKGRQYIVKVENISYQKCAWKYQFSVKKDWDNVDEVENYSFTLDRIKECLRNLIVKEDKDLEIADLKRRIEELEKEKVIWLKYLPKKRLSS